MEVVFFKNMELGDFRFISNMSRIEFGDETICMVNQREQDCFIGFLKNGDMFFIVDNVPLEMINRIDDVIMMSERFQEFNNQIYVRFDYLVECYLDYLHFP